MHVDLNRKELLKSVHYFVHLNLCISLILAYILFVAGVDNAIRNRVSTCARNVCKLVE